MNFHSDHLKSRNQIKYSYTNIGRFYWWLRDGFSVQNINICLSNSHQKSKYTMANRDSSDRIGGRETERTFSAEPCRGEIHSKQFNFGKTSKFSANIPQQLILSHLFVLKLGWWLRAPVWDFWRNANNVSHTWQNKIETFPPFHLNIHIKSRHVSLDINFYALRTSTDDDQLWKNSE